MLAVQSRLIPSPQRGFTLIEVLVVLSIILVLYAAFAPSFSSMASSNSFQAALRLLHSDLKSLRTTAILSGQTKNLEIAPDGLSYRVGDNQRNLSSGIHISVIRPLNAAKSSITYQSNGKSDGFVIKVSTDNQSAQIHSNWLTGRLQIITGSSKTPIKKAVIGES